MSTREGRIDIKANIKPYLKDAEKVIAEADRLEKHWKNKKREIRDGSEGIRETRKEADRLESYWDRMRPKIIREIRVTVAAIRRVSRAVAVWLEEVGIVLTPVQRALVDSSLAVASWILSVEAAISAGTMGIGMAVASASAAVGIMISLQAAVRAEEAIGAQRDAILRQGRAWRATIDILEVVGGL